MKIRQKMVLIGLWVIVLIPRIYFASMFQELRNDEQNYMEVAQNYIRTGRYTSTIDLDLYGLEVVRAPLVPWILSLIIRVVHPQSILPFRLVFALLSSFVFFSSFVFVRRLGARESVSALVAFVVSLHPYNTLVGPKLLTESLFPTLIATVFASMAGWRIHQRISQPVCTGIWLALASFCRPTILPLVFILPVAWFLEEKRLRSFGLIAACCAIVAMAPWIVEMRIQHKVWIPITSAGSYNVWATNNDIAYPDNVPPPLPADIRDMLKGMTEKERMEWFKREALLWIRRNPNKFWIMRWRQFSSFWRLYPTDLFCRKAPFGKYYGVGFNNTALIAAGKILWFAGLNILLVSFFIEIASRLRAQRAEMLSIVLLLLAVTLAHTVFPGDPRYRYPFDVVWMILALFRLCMCFFRRRCMGGTDLFSACN